MKTAHKNARPDRPPAAHIDDDGVEAIPPKIRQANRFVVWRWVWKDREQKWDKPPIDPETGHEIDQTDPANWMPFGKARRAARKHGDGIGIALGSKDNRLGVVGIDLDDCIDDQGNLTAKAREIVERFDSYTERTPSGQGLRIFIWGDKPGPKCRTKGYPDVEIYEADRYFTLTGRHVPGTPTQISRRDEALAWLYGAMFGKKPASGSRTSGEAPSGHPAASDEDLIERARRSKNGAAFAALFDRGDVSAYADDDSAADLALCNSLAFWLDRDPGRIESAFGRSALGQREKWRERADYRKRTIDRAVADCQQTYSPRPGVNGHGGGNGKPSANGTANGNASSSYITSEKGTVRSCVTNAMRWLRLHGPRIELDTFRDRVLVGLEPLRDGHLVELTSAMEVAWRTVVAKAHVEDAVRTLAHENAFSSLERYLGALEWDGIGRIEHFFEDYFGVADTPYHREVGRILHISAVARGMAPGCKADTVPLLIGDQGIGKSDIILHLCPDAEWFTDEVGNIGADRAGENLRGKWIVEMSELSRVNQGTIESVKKFIACQRDRYKVPYERESRDFARTNIFVGTSNDETPLRDLENRRFLPVRIPPRGEEEKNRAVEAVTGARDQLWAEAMHRFRAGEKWWTTSSYLAAEAQEEGRTAREADAWEDLLAMRLQSQQRTTVIEAAALLGIQPDRLGRSEQTRIGKALKAIGFRKDREKTPPRAWYYERGAVLP